ncbi:hypothetical protein D3C77_561330 [compost metagenome]
MPAGQDCNLVDVVNHQTPWRRISPVQFGRHQQVTDVVVFVRDDVTRFDVLVHLAVVLVKPWDRVTGSSSHTGSHCPDQIDRDHTGVSRDVKQVLFHDR